MNHRQQYRYRMKRRKLIEKKKIPVSVGDSFNTIIYIDADENPETAIKKYLRDIEESEKFSVVNFTKGNSKLFKSRN